MYQEGPLTAPLARASAALLACPDAIFSHRSAAALLMRVMPESLASGPIDVTHPDGLSQARRPGIRAHRALLHPDEITRSEGLPVTSAVRTLYDLSRVASVRELERALAYAERGRLVTRDDLAALLQRYAGRPGTRRLERLIANGARVDYTLSEAEEKLRTLLHTAGIRGAGLNVSVCGYRVDCYWSHARLVLEVDGFAFHSSAPAFVSDRRCDATLAAAGIQVLRLSWQQIENERDKTLVQIAQALARAEERLGASSIER